MSHFPVLCSSGEAKRLNEMKTSTSFGIMVEKDKEMRGNTPLTQAVSHYQKIKLSADTSFLLAKHANLT